MYGLSYCTQPIDQNCFRYWLVCILYKWNLNSGALWLESAELGDITWMVLSRGKRQSYEQIADPKVFIIGSHNLLPAHPILYQLKCNCNMNMASYSKIAMSRVLIEYRQLSAVCLTSKCTLIP